MEKSPALSMKLSEVAREGWYKTNCGCLAWINPKDTHFFKFYDGIGKGNVLAKRHFEHDCTVEFVGESLDFSVKPKA